MGRRCPVCGGKYRELFGVNMCLPESFHLDGGIKVVCCDACGCCFSASNSTQEDYDYYYTHSNYYATNPIENKGEEIRTLVDLCDEFINDDASVCDVGFGSGALLREFKRRGYNKLYGIDPAEESVASLKSEVENVYRGNIYERNQDFSKAFDLVTVVDVFEHLYNPKAALGILREYIKEKGYLAICVPDFSNIERNGNPIPDVFNQEHINYFSGRSLDNLMETEGFERVGYKDFYGVELILLYRKSSRAFSSVEVKSDKETNQKILEYYMRQKSNMERMDSVFDELWNEDYRKIYVWGVGAFAMWLIANTRLREFELHFIDGNQQKQGMEYLGSKIMPPESLTEDWPIAICAMHSVEAIRKNLMERKIYNRQIVFGE